VGNIPVVPVVNEIRTYWWRSPPRTGRQRTVAAGTIGARRGATLWRYLASRPLERVITHPHIFRFSSCCGPGDVDMITTIIIIMTMPMMTMTAMIAAIMIEAG
jgi:hypothetical protein